MPNLLTFASAAIALLVSSGLSIAAAVYQPSDRITLTDAQQKRAYDDLFMPPFAQTPPSGFKATIGVLLPRSIATAPVTSKAANDVPELRPYEFAMIKNKLLIVNPSDHRIAEVVSR